MQIADVAHVHPKDRPCAFCLASQGQELPAELLVEPAVRIPRARRLALEIQHVTDCYRRLNPHERTRIRQLLDLLLNGSPTSPTFLPVDSVNGGGNLLIFSTPRLQARHKRSDIRRHMKR